MIIRYFDTKEWQRAFRSLPSGETVCVLDRSISAVGDDGADTVCAGVVFAPTLAARLRQRKLKLSASTY